MQIKPAKLSEDEAKRLFFDNAMKSLYSAINTTDADPCIKLSKRIKPSVCALDDMFQATLGSIDGTSLPCT